VIESLTNERGVVGLTLPPTFPKQPWLYAYATRKVGGVAEDQIVRIKMNGGCGAPETPPVPAWAGSVS
jgi:hypothetical protein